MIDNSIDKETFFKNMIIALMNTNIVENRYKLQRSGNDIFFFGDGFRIFLRTKVVDDSQLKEYFDKLSTTYKENFRTFPMPGLMATELVVFVNGKFIQIDSDNPSDDWIFEKKHGRSPSYRKTK